MKKSALLIVAILAIFLVGCQKGTTNTQTASTPYVGGTNGIAMSFGDDLPAEVTDDKSYPFDISVKLKNEGEQEVLPANIKLTIGGLYAPDFGKTAVQLVSESGKIDTLVPRKKDSTGKIIESTPVYYSFPSFSYQNKLPGNTIRTIQATACYKYASHAIVKYCVKQDLIGSTQGVCEVNEAKEVFNSGAPVQVTSFDQNAAGKDKFHFTFKIQKFGTADIYDMGKDCAGGQINLNKVKVSITTDLAGLSCTGLSNIQTTGNVVSGFAKLSNEEATIACNQAVSSLGDYEKNAQITVEYDVRDTISRDIVIKRLDIG